MIKKNMQKLENMKVNDKNVCKPGMRGGCGGCGGALYGMGFLGAAIYYISTATGFWNGVWGVIKAIVWPAFLTFSLFKTLGL